MWATKDAIHTLYEVRTKITVGRHGDMPHRLKFSAVVTLHAVRKKISILAYEQYVAYIATNITVRKPCVGVCKTILWALQASRSEMAVHLRRGTHPAPISSLKTHEMKLQPRLA